MTEFRTTEQLEFAVGRLVRLVDTRRITQKQLENLSGVAQSTISKILHDKHLPNSETLAKLFGALGLRLGDILNDADRLSEGILGYMATPLTGLSPAADAEVRRVVGLVNELVAGAGFPAPHFVIYWPGSKTHPKDHSAVSSQQVYVTDRSRASTHDFIIQFCATPSYGVGQENEIATQAGVPALRLVPEVGLSRMMKGSFLSGFDVQYAGSLETGVSFDGKRFVEGLRVMRALYFRHRALYKDLTPDTFGPRLRQLIDDRCSGDYQQFADDLGISLAYVHHLMDEPYRVSNPSFTLLRRMALRLRERVAYLTGETDDHDPAWIDSDLSWHEWIAKTKGIEAAVAVRIRDDWREKYRTDSLRNASTTSHREAGAMTAADWAGAYQLHMAAGRNGASHATTSLF